MKWVLLFLLLLFFMVIGLFGKHVLVFGLQLLLKQVYLVGIIAVSWLRPGLGLCRLGLELFVKVNIHAIITKYKMKSALKHNLLV